MKWPSSHIKHIEFLWRNGPLWSKMRPFALTHVRLAALLDAHNSHKSNKKFCNKNHEMAFYTKRWFLEKLIWFWKLHWTETPIIGLVDAIHAHWGDLVRKTIGSTCTTITAGCCSLSLHLYLAIEPFHHSAVNWKLLCGFCPKFPTGFLDLLFRFSHSIDLLYLASFWQNSHLGKVDSLENSYPLNSRT